MRTDDGVNRRGLHSWKSIDVSVSSGRPEFLQKCFSGRAVGDRQWGRRGPTGGEKGGRDPSSSGGGDGYGDYYGVGFCGGGHPPHRRYGLTGGKRKENFVQVWRRNWKNRIIFMRKLIID